MEITQAEAPMLIETVSFPKSNPVSRKQTLRAVGMIIGYYVFALAMLAGLTLATLLFMVIFFPVAALTMVGALSILMSIVPRPDRFHAPGPRLDTTSQPRLFEKLSDVAQAMG